MDLFKDCSFLGAYLHHALSVRHCLFRGVPACGMDSSTATIPWGCLILQGLLQEPVPSEIDLLQHGLTHSHSPFRNRPEIVPTWPHPWLQALQGCSCSVMGLSIATFFEVLQHNLVHSHWSYRVHLLQQGSSTATDASKCAFSCMDLSLGQNSFRGASAVMQA